MYAGWLEVGGPPAKSEINGLAGRDPALRSARGEIQKKRLSV